MNFHLSGGVLTPYITGDDKTYRTFLSPVFCLIWFDLILLYLWVFMNSSEKETSPNPLVLVCLCVRSCLIRAPPSFAAEVPVWEPSALLLNKKEEHLFSKIFYKSLCFVVLELLVQVVLKFVSSFSLVLRWHCCVPLLNFVWSLDENLVCLCSSWMF